MSAGRRHFEAQGGVSTAAAVDLRLRLKKPQTLKSLIKLSVFLIKMKISEPLGSEIDLLLITNS
jgi:hypothetical protein